MLAHDKRLKKQIDISPATLNGYQILNRIQRETGVELILNHDSQEFGGAKIIIACHNLPAFALMDAFAAFPLARWYFTAKKNYELSSEQSQYDFTFDPTGPYDVERHRAGREFIASLSKLPDDERKHLFSPEGVPFTSLSAPMQQEVRDMFGAIDDEYRAKGGDPTMTVPIEKVVQGKFILTVKQPYKFDEYFGTILIPGWGSSGWEFNNYREWKQKNEEERQKQKKELGGLDPLYTTLKYEMTQQNALELPALKQIVDIHLKKANFYQVLRDLNVRYGVSFISETTRSMGQRANVDINGLPLGEALNRLTQIYNFTEWEYRPDGFLLVRGPYHPKRDRKKGELVPPYIPTADD